MKRPTGEIEQITQRQIIILTGNIFQTKLSPIKYILMAIHFENQSNLNLL